MGVIFSPPALLSGPLPSTDQPSVSFPVPVLPCTHCLAYLPHRASKSEFEMVVVVRDVAVPEEVDIPSRVAKPAPYAVCCGCNGSVQTDVYEVNTDIVNQTWHLECYEGDVEEDGVGMADHVSDLAAKENDT